MKNEIQTQKAPAAIGPYSQAISIGEFVFTSGQIPIDPTTGAVIAGEIEEQTVQVLDNLKNVLEAGNSNFASVIKTTVFIKDMNHFPAINAIYERYFSKPFPARSCVEVSRLPKDVLIEIEAIAISNLK